MPPRPLSFRTSLRLASLSIAAAVALGGTACHSGPPRGPGGGREAVHIPIMEASGKFFDNQLLAEIHFGRAKPPTGAKGGPNSSGEGGGPSGAGRGPRGGGGGGGFSANVGPMGMGMGGGGGSRGPGGGGGGPPESSSYDGPSGGSRVRIENNPAVQLHLTLSNQGTRPLDVEILEFSSVLGNFVVTPAKVSIAPGTTATFDPMTSRLGIPQGDLPLKVRLRSAGKTEEQTLTLKIIGEDGPPPGPPAP